MLLLRILRVLALLVGIISLPLVFVGWGLFISIPMFAFAYVISGAIQSNPKDKPVRSKAVINSVIIIAGLASFFALYALGAIGNTDTTGKGSPEFLAISFAACFLITTLILWIVNRR